MSIFVHMKEGDCVWECPFPYILANTEWLMFCFFFLVPGVAEFAASFKSPITSSPPKWMAEIERDDIDMLKELGSLTTANLMEKVRGLQNLAYQLGLDESREMTRGKFLNILEKPKK